MPDTVTMDTAQLDKLISERLDALLPQKLREIEEGRTPSLTIIATKGTLDWAYPPFILASTAAALGWNAAIFFGNTSSSFAFSHASRLSGFILSADVDM